MPFVVAPGIYFTATEDFITLLSLHPSIFLTIESPTISAFFRFVPPPIEMVGEELRTVSDSINCSGLQLFIVFTIDSSSLN